MKEATDHKAKWRMMSAPDTAIVAGLACQLRNPMVRTKTTPSPQQMKICMKMVLRNGVGLALRLGGRNRGGLRQIPGDQYD